MTIVEFLAARLADDELCARNASRRGRAAWAAEVGFGPPVSVRSRGGEMARTWVEEGEHIARHDPARVLADVAAYADHPEFDPAWKVET